MSTHSKSLKSSDRITPSYSRRFAINLIIIFVILTAIWLLLTPGILNNFVSEENIPGYLGGLRQWLLVAAAVFIFYFVTKKDKNIISSLEEKLEDSTAKLGLVLDVNEDGLWELEIKSGKFYFSDKFREIVPIESKDKVFSLEDFLIQIDEEFKNEVKESFGLLKNKQQKEFFCEFRLRVNNGDGVKWVKCYGKKFESEEGENTNRIIGFVKDITEYKTAKLEQQDLLYQRDVLLKRLKLQIDKMPIGYMLYDKDFNIQFMNPAAQHIFNYSIDELKGKQPYGYIFDRDQQESFEETRREIIEHGDTSVIVLENTRKEGTKIYCEWFNTPLWSESGELNLLSMVVDITSKVEAELELKAARDKAEESSNMKSIFLAQMSHEIRTPVSTILNYTSMLHEYLHNSSEDNFSEIFYSIDNGARRLIRTIELILNMSQLQTGYYETEKTLVDLESDIVEPLVEDIKSAALIKGLDIFIENTAGEAKFVSDSYISTQIISNLVDNAIKYTQKGHVKIAICRDELNRVCVQIEDTGIGISREYLDKLFTPFSQEEMGYTRSFEGNGLGLALVKKYCDLINAEIKVDSEKGKGSTFTIIFGESVRENQKVNSK